MMIMTASLGLVPRSKNTVSFSLFPSYFLFFFSSFPSFFPQWNSALNLDPRNFTKENNNPALIFRGAFPWPRCSCEEWSIPRTVSILCIEMLRVNKALPLEWCMWGSPCTLAEKHYVNGKSRIYLKRTHGFIPQGKSLIYVLCLF